MNQLSGKIEHSLLKPTATAQQIKQLCQEAIEFGFYSVCVNPCHVTLARSLMGQSRVTTVIGFPLGAGLTKSKVHEALEAVRDGADELDMVMAIHQAKSGNWTALKNDIEAVVHTTPGVIHKVIIEACYLTDEEIRSAVEVAISAGAEYVKTSTGFGSGGATVHDVRLMVESASGRAKVKAAGGIKTYEQAMALINVGADLLGTSSGPSIVGEAKES